MDKEAERAIAVTNWDNEAVSYLRIELGLHLRPEGECLERIGIHGGRLLKLARNGQPTADERALLDRALQNADSVGPRSESGHS